MKAPKGYVLRIETADGESEYVAVNSFTVQRYACGLVAGERLVLKKVAPGEPAEEAAACNNYTVGEVMEVLLGVRY